MHSLLPNLRYALRQFRRAPGFAATVVITLALGIGATTAVFTFLDQVLLRMLPVEKPQQLVRFDWHGAFSGSMSSFGGDHGNFFSYPMYKDLRDQNQVFSGMLAADRGYVGVTWHNQAESEDAEIVSGNYFQLLGLHPAAGRLFTQQDDTQEGANPVVVLSYNYWKTRFGADQSVIGQNVLINGHPFQIVGVAPINFNSAIGGYRPGVFIPISMSNIAMPWMVPRKNLTNHQSIWLTLVARLKPGVTAKQAEASLGPLWHSLRAYELTLYKSVSPRFRQGFLDKTSIQVLDDSTGFNPGRLDLKTPLIILFCMAGLLVAMCAINVATLLLLRASARAREMSMRYALGARRSRIVGQLLLEGGLLGGAGAVMGLVMAPAVANSLIRLMMNSNPGDAPYSASLDGRMIAFTLALTIVVSLLFSLAPIFHFLRPDLAQDLRQSAGTATRTSQRFREIAVGVQIALSVILLGGAGLFVRTLDNLRNQPVGFNTGNLLTFTLDPTASGYSGERTPAVVTSAIEALRQVPGVSLAAATTDPVLAGDQEWDDFTVQGYKPREDENMDFEDSFVTPGYFATLKEPVLVGREFTEGDAKGQPKVAIVNLAFAKRFYGSAQNAIGRLIGEGGPKDAADMTIVGVAGDAKHADLRTEISPNVYRPYLQMEHPVGVQVYVRTAAAPEIVEPAIRAAMRQLDSTLVVDGLRTMDEQVDRSASDERALATLAIAFSILAMVLAAVGLYGVLAYSTEQRTREIGVRLALGAQRSRVVALVLREMLLIACLGILVAVPSIVALARLFRSQLYGVSAADPLALILAVGLTVVMVAGAAALPARRAVSVAPAVALRNE
ncbi:MAG TPA: ABC transporter permease [Terracidiphilus sp.]|nr:ABC transporter permease [Terracidiphilus sp.]